MTKTEIKSEQVEIVKQVRLTSNQRSTLVEMQTKGGRYDGHSMDWKTRVELQNLLLIEERPRYSPKELRDISAQLTAKWRELTTLVRVKDLSAADRKVNELQELSRRVSQTAWWLTQTADEYLLKGRVIISR